MSLLCEDCGKEVAVDDYRPLDLMRPDPSASRWVWDATKQKLVHRPRNAAVGGRRFRVVDLCRRCAGEALRKRSMNSGTVMEGGKKRALRTRERLAPKRGGRPRLLDERQLRQLHRLYERHGLSINDLVAALLEGGRVKGTRAGLYQSILYGWRKLKLPLRGTSEAIALAHHRRGRKPREPQRCPASTRKGIRCRLFAKVGATYCVSHQHLEAIEEHDELERRAA